MLDYYIHLLSGVCNHYGCRVIDTGDSLYKISHCAFWIHFRVLISVEVRNNVCLLPEQSTTMRIFIFWMTLLAQWIAMLANIFLRMLLGPMAFCAKRCVTEIVLLILPFYSRGYVPIDVIWTG
jgi:hypothetical protein